MSFETIHAARHAHAAKRFAPGNGVGLIAGNGRKCIRRSGASPDKTVNLFLNVDERLFHAFSDYYRGNPKNFYGGILGMNGGSAFTGRLLFPFILEKAVPPAKHAKKRKSIEQ